MSDGSAGSVAGGDESANDITADEEAGPEVEGAEPSTSEDDGGSGEVAQPAGGSDVDGAEEDVHPESGVDGTSFGNPTFEEETDVHVRVEVPSEGRYNDLSECESVGRDSVEQGSYVDQPREPKYLFMPPILRRFIARVLSSRMGPCFRRFCSCVVDEDEDIGREKWTRETDFLMSCIGFSVGLGNVWRFPYLCYKHGGGAFLIPYLIAMLCGGIPIMFQEVILGQMMFRGGIEAWNILPICKGIGVMQIFIIFLIVCYYNVIICWTIFYFFASFTSTLPWSHCGNEWNTAQCIVTGKAVNLTAVDLNSSDPRSLKQHDSVVEFWERKVLGISDGLESMGAVKWDSCLCLLLAWIITYFCLAGGIKSSGKVVYITATAPYVFMFVLLIQAATLPGAVEGLKYYLVPDMTKMGNTEMWVDAGTQIFFSMSISMGVWPALGSYNKFTHKSLRDCLIYALINALTSFFAGFVIFLTLGYMAHISGEHISKVAQSGPGLAFIAYPKALATMPAAPLWAFFFFIMLILLGVDSQFISAQGFLTATTELFPRHLAKNRYRDLYTLLLCFVCFLIGLSMVTNGGMYVFQLFDNFSGAKILLLISGLQCLAISYLYGADKFSEHIKKMIWYPESLDLFFKVFWAGISPAFVFIIFIVSAVNDKRLSYQGYTFPTAAIALGWFVMATGVALIPIVAIYKLIRARGYDKFIDRLKFLLRPSYPEDSELFREIGGEDGMDPDDIEMCGVGEVADSQGGHSDVCVDEENGLSERRAHSDNGSIAVEGYDNDVYTNEYEA